MFEKELAFFISKQSDLVKKHKGKILAIKGEKVVGVYDTALDAYLYTKLHNQLGQVMLQRCIPGAEAYTSTRSR